MTLATSFVIEQPTDPFGVFTFCRSLIGAGDFTTWKHDRPGQWKWQLNNQYRNDAGQGLCALLDVEYGPEGGPLLDERYLDEDWTVTEVGHHDPFGYVEVGFDTAYSYSGPGGLNCSELHAGLVARLGRWCEERGLSYRWQNEYTGEWFPDWRVAADELGQSGEAAREWFFGTVLPVIEAEHGPVTL